MVLNVTNSKQFKIWKLVDVITAKTLVFYLYSRNISNETHQKNYFIDWSDEFEMSRLRRKIVETIFNCSVIYKQFLLHDQNLMLCPIPFHRLKNGVDFSGSFLLINSFLIVFLKGSYNDWVKHGYRRTKW